MAEEPPVAADSLLADLRRAAGLTQEELAERTGLSTRGISSIECGRVTRPHRRSLESIAVALDLGPTDRSQLLRHYRRRTGPAAPAQPDDAERTGRTDPAGPVLSSPALRPAQLPAALPGFVGRAPQLRRLDALLAGADAGRSMLIATVDGTAGVGKTALVLHWAHRVRGRFPDGQLYVNLRGYGPGTPADPAVVLAQFLAAVGVPADQLPADTEARAGLFRSTLVDRRMLVVLDNARNAGQVRPLLPGGAGCVVVVTSRNQLAGLSVRDGAYRVSLDQLDDEDATALLGRYVGAARLAAEPGAVAGILSQCAGLPLALSLVGDLATRERTLPEVATELADHRTRLAVLADEDDDTSVRTVFSWSYQALPIEVAGLFRLLALHPGPDIGLPAAAALAGLTPQHTRRLLDTLTGGHLIEQRRAGRYEFHDLLRAYARDLTEQQDSGPERSAAVHRLLDHYLGCALAAGTLLDPGDGSLLTRLATAAGPAVSGESGRFTDLDGARAWLDAERANLVAAAGYAAAEGWAAHAGDLSDALWRYLHQAAWHDDARTLHAGALAAARATGDRRREARALFNLGTVHHRLGANEVAIGQLTGSAEIAGTLHDPVGEARARDYLGLIHTSVGDLDGAMRDHEMSLTLFRDAGHREGEGCSLNNLGLVCRRLGRQEDALGYFEQARQITREVGDRATEGGATNNIGLILRRLGRFDTALQHFQDALAIAREIGHREGEGFAASNIGSTYASLGRYDTAGEFQQTALRLARRTGMPALEAIALNQLGRIARLLGDSAGAAARYRAALAVSDRIGARYEQALALEGLGETEDGLHRPREAARYRQQALEIYTELGTDRADELRRRITAAAQLPGAPGPPEPGAPGSVDG